MLLGPKLKVYTDHKFLINLMAVSKSPQIQRRQRTIEEFSKHDNKLNLLVITICNPATGWLEVAEINDETATKMTKILDQVWFFRSP
jgi:sugar diacid utilization regulator